MNAGPGVRRAMAAVRSNAAMTTSMAKGLIDADVILNRAKSLAHQQAAEIQPYGHLVRLPIALAESACKESVAGTSVVLSRSRSLSFKTESSFYMDVSRYKQRLSDLEAKPFKSHNTR